MDSGKPVESSDDKDGVSSELGIEPSAAADNPFADHSDVEAASGIDTDDTKDLLKDSATSDVAENDKTDDSQSNNVSASAGEATSTEGDAKLKEGDTKKAPASGRKLRADEAKEGIDPTAAAKSAVELRKDPSVVLAELLNKRSERGLIHSWQKRWMMLVGNLLYYFEKEDSAKPKGVVLLEGATVQCCPLKQFKNQECIVVTTKTKRVFYIYGTAAQNTTWTAAIKAVQGVTYVAPDAAAESTAVAGSADAPAPASPDSKGKGPEDGTKASATESTSGDSSSSGPASASVGAALAAAAPSRSPRSSSGGGVPGAEFGVTETMNALISDLPPELQVAWVSILSAATRAKELEGELAVAKAQVSSMSSGGSSGGEGEGEAEVRALKAQLQELKAAAEEMATARERAASASDSAVHAEVTLLRQQLANASSKLELARIESEGLKREAGQGSALKAQIAELTRKLAQSEAKADSAAGDAAVDYVKVVKMEKELSTVRAELAAARADVAKAEANAGASHAVAAELAAAKAAAAKAAADAEALRARVGSLEKEVASARPSIAAAEARVAEAERKSAKAEGLSEALKVKNDILKEALTEAQAEIGKLQAAASANGAVAGELAAAKARIASLEGEVAAAKQAVSSAAALAATAGDAELQATVKGLEQELTELDAANERLKMDANKWMARAKELETALARSRDGSEFKGGAFDFTAQ